MARAGTWLSVVMVVVVSTGCGADPAGGAGPEGGRVEQGMELSAAEADEIFLAEAKKWSLPPGWTWPTPPIHERVTPDGVTHVYDRTYGEMTATYHWYCAWAKTLVEADTPAEESDALRQLRDVEKTRFYRSLESTELQDETLEAARRHDYGPLAEDVELNCSGLK